MALPPYYYAILRDAIIIISDSFRHLYYAVAMMPPRRHFPPARHIYICAIIFDTLPQDAIII